MMGQVQIDRIDIKKIVEQISQMMGLPKKAVKKA